MVARRALQEEPGTVLEPAALGHRPERAMRPAPALGLSANQRKTEQAKQPGYAARAGESIVRIASWLRLPEFLLGIALLWSRTAVRGMPMEIAYIAITAAVCSFVRPSVRNRAVPWFSLLYLTMLAWAVLVSIENDAEYLQRSFRFFLLFLLAIILAEGRLHWKSVIAGLCFALVFINAPAYYLGLTSDNYHPYLTGFISDKNVAGYYYAVLGLLGMTLYSTKRAKIIHFIVFAVLLWLTGSRTSISALGVGIAWYFFRNRISQGMRFLLTPIGIWMLWFVEQRYSRVGVFSDREGTDWFRGQIDAATSVKLEQSPWYGDGLNTAWVYVSESRTMLFHDSYAALRVEGGIPMFVIMLILVVGICIGFFSSVKQVSPTLLATEAGLVAVMVCAWKLGEVFFTMPCFLLMGIAMYERYGEPIPDEPTTPIQLRAQHPPVARMTRGI